MVQHPVRDMLTAQERDGAMQPGDWHVRHVFRCAAEQHALKTHCSWHSCQTEGHTGARA